MRCSSRDNQQTGDNCEEIILVKHKESIITNIPMILFMFRCYIEFLNCINFLSLPTALDIVLFPFYRWGN